MGHMEVNPTALVRSLQRISEFDRPFLGQRTRHLIDLHRGPIPLRRDGINLLGQCINALCLPDIPALFPACIPGIASSNTSPFPLSSISSSEQSTCSPTFLPSCSLAAVKNISGSGFPFIFPGKSSPHTTFSSKHPNTSVKCPVFI